MFKFKKGYSYAIRAAGAFFVIALLMFLGGARLISINLKNYETTATSQGQYTLNVYKHRGTVFDRHMRPLTNLPGAVTASAVATPEAITKLRDYLPAAKFEETLQRLETGKPVLLELEEKIAADGITIFDTFTQYSGLAPHIIGYLGSNGHGASGIEADWDNLLYSEETTTVSYSCDAYGNALSGIDPIISGKENTAVLNGVVLTIDGEIQRIVQEETENLGCGAVVILDPNTGEVLALHSFPTFNQYDPASDLESPDSPFLNRALSSYNTGSVFKSCIAAAALESGIESETQFSCNGWLDVGGVNFVCNRNTGHSQMTLSSALAHSCNVYFYELALSTEPPILFSTAQNLGFGKSLKLSVGLQSQAGSLTEQSLLELSPASVANFAIGQGDVMVSPLNLAAAYAAIANGGTYREPKLISGVVQNEVFSETLSGEEKTILSNNTCKTITEALKLAVAEGTGKAAQPEYCQAAGKTATAQTGWEKNGHSVLISWFAGYFPADDPQYVMVIMKEDGSSGSSDCAPVFKSIADRLYLLP